MGNDSTGKPSPSAAPSVSALPFSIETGTVDPDNPHNPVQGSRVFMPAAQQVAPLIDGSEKGALAGAIAAGRVCKACRYFDKEAGQRKFARERLWQGVVRELAHQPHWWDPAKYGMCQIDRRTATHEGASCDNFVPVSRLVSFFGKRTGR